MLATAEAAAMQPFTAFESSSTTAQTTSLPPPKTSAQTSSQQQQQQEQQQRAARQAAMDVLSPARSPAFSDQAAASAEAAFGPGVRLGDEAHGLIAARERSESHVSVQPPLGPAAEDLVHELLAMNTLAMERGKCGALDEAIALLAEAYEKLSGELAAQRITDEQLLDQLKATTLNNMGVTECHRGQPRHAISHFEAARQLEERWNIASPSLALNSCAAYNALGMYDKATAAALEAIDLLRTLELQRKRTAQLAAAAAATSEENTTNASEATAMNVAATLSPSKQFDTTGTLSRNVCLISNTGDNNNNNNNTNASVDKEGRVNGSSALAATNSAARRTQAETELIAAAAHPAVADSQNAALWGAAWHNLAVAQLNTAREARRALAAGTPTATSGSAQMEHTNTLVIFHNAMRATQELLGLQHPMSRAVVETFRAARRALQKCGAFKQHHSLLTAPGCAIDARTAMEATAQVAPWPGCTRHATVQRQQQQLTITFRGEVTGGTAVLERLDPTPYPGAIEEAFRRTPQPCHAASTRDLPRPSRARHGASTRSHTERSTRQKTTSVRAAEVYGAPQPTLGASESRTRHVEKEVRDGVMHTNDNTQEENHAVAYESDAAEGERTRAAIPRNGTRPTPPQQRRNGQPRRPLRASEKAAGNVSRLYASSQPYAQSQKGSAGQRGPAAAMGMRYHDNDDDDNDGTPAGNSRTAATTLPPIHERRIGGNNSNTNKTTTAGRPSSRNASPNQSAGRPQRTGYAATQPNRRGGNNNNNTNTNTTTSSRQPQGVNGAPCTALYEVPNANNTEEVAATTAAAGLSGNYAVTSPPGPWQARPTPRTNNSTTNAPTTTNTTTTTTTSRANVMQMDALLANDEAGAMTARELNATQRPSSQRTMTQSRLLLLAEPVALSGQPVRTVYCTLPATSEESNNNNNTIANAPVAATGSEAVACMTNNATGVMHQTLDVAAVIEGNGTASATTAVTMETVGTQADDAEAGRLARRHSATQTPGRDAEVSFDPTSASNAAAAAETTTMMNSPHHLFNAMWVAADVGYVRHGKRELGRPGYYISNVLNVDDTGEVSREVGGATQPVLVYDSSEASSETSAESGAKQS